MKLPISVIVTTLNEAHNIRDCLASVSEFAQEVIVLDSGSQDATTALATQAGAKVYITDDWPGFGPQKNRALSYATQPWVLSIDADERVTPTLQKAIAAVLDHAEYAGYEIPRLSQFCGRWVKHSGWYPDYVLRLFRRNAGRFSERLVHESVVVDGPVGRLSEHFLHYSYTSTEQVEDKIRKYGNAGAEELRRHNKRISASAPWLHGTWAFIRTFIMRRGFLDGRTGLAIARMNARVTYIKYAQARRST